MSSYSTKTDTPVKSQRGEYNCGKLKDKMTGKETVVPEPQPACSEPAPCQRLWGLSENVSQRAGFNLRVRRAELLADFVVMLPWDSRH